jgi:hypothetical protein
VNPGELWHRLEQGPDSLSAPAKSRGPMVTLIRSVRGVCVGVVAEMLQGGGRRSGRWRRAAEGGP